MSTSTYVLTTRPKTIPAITNYCLRSLTALRQRRLVIASDEGVVSHQSAPRLVYGRYTTPVALHAVNDASLLPLKQTRRIPWARSRSPRQ